MWFRQGLLKAVAALSCTSVVNCSKLLSGGTIIAFNETTADLQVIRNGSLLLTGDRIISIFNTSSPPNLPSDIEVIDCTERIITPGFIDTHRHGWQTVYKTLGSNTTLAEYLLRYGQFVSASYFTPEDVYISQLTGIYETLAAGWCKSFFAYAFHNSSAEFGVLEQIEQWKELASGMKGNLTQLAISYDGWTGNPTGADTKSIVDLMQSSNVSVMTTHGVEGPWLAGNMPSMLSTLGLLNTSTPIIFSHASFLTPRDATLLRNFNKHISITPESDMHYGQLHPTSHLIQDQASLGVDTHFTFSADILTQARMWLQSTRYRIYIQTEDRWEIPSKSPFSVTQAFLLATRNGGLALGRPDLGIIAPNAKADLVIWNGRSPALLEWRDPVAAVILHASVGDIESVLVGGEFKKRGGELVVKGYEGVVEKFLESAERIQGLLKGVPLPPQEGDVIPGFVYGWQEQVDVVRGEGTGCGRDWL